VSNDNPYAESIFRTCKYRPNYPVKGFDSLNDARAWVINFVDWYNRHSGLKFLTPDQRHKGLTAQILEARRQVYETAKAKNPGRWSGNTRDWSLEDEVWLNPEKTTPIETEKVSTN